ncbi:hypothetical protein DSO57_1026679 [Entomophthora muscae]|uniref:Uncharacterized protein n=1 Tax=Entomophthora muscae TaxID=34485 RepID=A0ACC2TQ93_9FUNG|nr:hypothetical protein DSO57_1026679 [Entomophthora muscae]
MPSKEAVDTISIPYVEQLCMSYAEVTHESDSVKKLSQLLRSVQVYKFGYFEILEAQPNNYAGVIPCPV